MIDLNGTDLVHATEGQVRIGHKDCNAGEPVQWESDTVPVMISYGTNQAPQIDFPASRYGD